MKKYAVFKKQTFVAKAELSISNKIIESEDKLKVLGIVREWIHRIAPEGNYIVCFLGDCEKATIMDTTMYSMAKGADLSLIVIQRPCNVRIQVGKYETSYEIGMVE